MDSSQTFVIVSAVQLQVQPDMLTSLHGPREEERTCHPIRWLGFLLVIRSCCWSLTLGTFLSPGRDHDRWEGQPRRPSPRDDLLKVMTGCVRSDWWEQWQLVVHCCIWTPLPTNMTDTSGGEGKRICHFDIKKCSFPAGEKWLKGGNKTSAIIIQQVQDVRRKKTFILDGIFPQQRTLRSKTMIERGIPIANK